MKKLFELLKSLAKETKEKKKQAIEEYIKDHFNEDLKTVRDVIELAEFQNILLGLYQSTDQQTLPFPIAEKISRRFLFKKKENYQFIKLDPNNIPADINPSEIVDNQWKNKYWVKRESQIVAPSVHSIMPSNPLMQILLNLTPRDLLRFSRVNHYYSKFMDRNFWKSLYKKYGFAGECAGKVDFLREYKKLTSKGTSTSIEDLYHAIAIKDKKTVACLLNNPNILADLKHSRANMVWMNSQIRERLIAKSYEYLEAYYRSLKINESTSEAAYLEVMAQCLIDLNTQQAPASLAASVYHLIYRITDIASPHQSKQTAIEQFLKEVQPWWKSVGKVLATIVIAATGIALGAAIGVALVLGGAWLLGAGLTLSAIIDLFAAGAVTTLTTSLAAGVSLCSVTVGTLSAFWLFKSTPEQTLAKNAKLITEFTQQNQPRLIST